MDRATLRAWWAHRQGLDGSLDGRTPREALTRAGWARSVGGANPYLTLFSRTGARLEDITDAARAMEIYELPSARGCTYVLPREDFALGLALSRGGDAASGRIAEKLGVTRDEVEGLKRAVEEALRDGPLDPNGLKKRLGDQVRSLGEAGKKAGVSSTLGFALGPLQDEGRIVRMPLQDRLDTQKYAYALWSDAPSRIEYEQALATVAERYWGWTGPASLAEFQWFTGVSAKAAREAVTGLGLVPCPGDPDRLILPGDLAEFGAFVAPSGPDYRLVGSLDSLFLLRRDLAPLVDEADARRPVFGERGLRAVRDLADLDSHGIADRGRLIGLWDFDPAEGKIVWQSWVPVDDALREAVDRTEAFVQELGDARSFSLDSPASRAGRLASLRA